MSETAPSELAGNFLEWQLIEDEKAALANRSKDLFKAMKDKGFNTKAARVVFREKRAALDATQADVAKAEEQEAEFDLYRAALDSGLRERARPAGARSNEHANSARPSPSASEQPETGRAESPVSGTDHPDPHPSKADGGQPHPSSNDAGAKNDGAFSIVGREPHVGSVSSGQFEQQSANVAQDRNEPVSAGDASAPNSSEPFTPPVFLRKSIRGYRTHCQNPGQCAGSGLNHCYACQKLADAQSEAA